MNASPIEYSVLDLCPVGTGQTASEALANSIKLAERADALGFKRYWFAEHHAMGAIASSSPEIMISQVARATRHLRVGSGGIMLPNHPSLRVAESFRTLEALFPGRIDLGIGRAPGTNGRTAVALRRNHSAHSADDFPEQLAELDAFLHDDFPSDHPYASMHAMPQGVGQPEIWLLGSSDYSARLAAREGRPFSFAHHFSEMPAELIVKLYKDNFRPKAEKQTSRPKAEKQTSRPKAEKQTSRPKAERSAPRAMVGVNVICAETNEEAERLTSSYDLGFLRLRQTGRFDPLPSVAEALQVRFSAEERYMLDLHRRRLFVGSPAAVKEQLVAFLERLGVEEAVVSSMIHDPGARRRSYELLAGALRLPAPSAA